MSNTSHINVAQSYKILRSGKYADIGNPTPADIDIRDITYALSHINRYTGHVGHYTVAEHCGMAAHLASIDGCSKDETLAVLLHDASEAYLNDISRPMKQWLLSVGCVAIRDLERKWESAIGERFGVDFGKHHDVIKTYDMQMMKFEKLMFWPDDATEWDSLDGVLYRPELEALFNRAGGLFSVMCTSLGIW